ARLDHQKQHPAIKKRNTGIKRFAQVGVLAANNRQARGEFDVDESAKERHDAAGNPCRENQKRSVDPFGNEIGIDENSDANNTAHHDHDGAKETKMTREAATYGITLVGVF